MRWQLPDLNIPKPLRKNGQSPDTVFALLLPAIVHAGSFMPSESDYYYELGGTSNLFVPPINKDQVIHIGADMDGRLGFSCSGFNPVVSITNSFQDMKQSAMNIPAGIINNLKGSVAAFPLYKLQQSMPGLYNIIQNAASFSQNEFTLKVKECQEVKQALEDHQSPVEGLLSVSDSQGWLEAANRAKKEQVDIRQISKTITQKRDEYGLPWIGHDKGNAGGTFQRPIKVIHDVVIAGYNILLSRKPLDSIAKPDVINPMTMSWPTPTDAANWAVKVLGDIQVSTSTNKNNHDTKAGMGLSALLQSCATANTCSQNIAKALWRLVDGSWPLDDAHLRKISAANLLITADIITTIQHLSKEEQLLTVSKLAEDIAVQNMLDKALMMRRILQAGLQVQEVQNLKPAINMVHLALKKLNDEIHSLNFEAEARKNMLTNTLGTLQHIRHQNHSNSVPGHDKEQAAVKHGAIYVKEE